ncbi:MAG: cytochrome c oxidase subunit II [Candidatus Tectimicrobiota bacterium]
MWSNIPLFPEQASTIAEKIDLLFVFLVGVSLFFAGLICALLVYFALRYRRRSEAEQPLPLEGNLRLELLWTGVPLALTMVMFFWGANLYIANARPPVNALEILAVGKQWMWKFQHPAGPREINELHVPVGQPVKLTLASEDVIHSFYVPAFRVKMDAVPGRYTSVWFEATKTGVFHLFCAEYCGTAHAGMIGRVVAQSPSDYERWLSGGDRAESPVAAGERLFQQLGCPTCHRPDGTGRGPTMEGLFGQTQRLQGGETVVVDEAYVRESILQPNAKVATGFAPVMPTFQGQISEEGLLQIIAYIRSLGPEKRR